MRTIAVVLIMTCLAACRANKVATSDETMMAGHVAVDTFGMKRAVFAVMRQQRQSTLRLDSLSVIIASPDGIVAAVTAPRAELTSCADERHVYGDTVRVGRVSMNGDTISATRASGVGSRFEPAGSGLTGFVSLAVVVVAVVWLLSRRPGGRRGDRNCE